MSNSLLAIRRAYVRAFVSCLFVLVILFAARTGATNFALYNNPLLCTMDKIGSVDISDQSTCGTYTSCPYLSFESTSANCTTVTNCLSSASSSSDYLTCLYGQECVTTPSTYSYTVALSQSLVAQFTLYSSDNCSSAFLLPSSRHPSLTIGSCNGYPARDKSVCYSANPAALLSSELASWLE